MCNSLPLLFAPFTAIPCRCCSWPALRRSSVPSRSCAMPSRCLSVPCRRLALRCHAVATPCPALLRNSDPFLLASVLCNSSAPPRRSLQFRCCSGISCHFRSLSLLGQSLLCHSYALLGFSSLFPFGVRLCLSIPQLRRSVRFRRLPCPFFAISMLVLALPSHFLSGLSNAFATLNYSMPSRF